MSGWRRLGIVLGAIYWAFALGLATLVYFTMRTGEGSGDIMSPFQASAISLIVSAVFYAMLAGLWWALAGFRKS